jgi:hypothetical protein
MKKAQPSQTYFFVDESGDPTFYDRKGNLIVGQEGCSPILLLGFVEIREAEPIRQAILELQKELVHDPYFQGFPSIKRTAVAFHAKDDLPEIRYEFFKLAAKLHFRAQFVVARKIERVFRNSFQAREDVFYDHLVEQLFQNLLHRFENNTIYFAKRGSRNRQQPLQQAINQSAQRFEEKWGAQVNSNFAIQAQTPAGEPCLSLIDYMNWAVYRAYTRGDMNYFNTIQKKVSLLVDLYDTAKYPKNWYNRKNPFDINKITPL